MILKKITSGRWILTVLAGIAFLYSVVYKILPPEAVATIITMVFISYFQKNERRENENSSNSNSGSSTIVHSE